MWKEGKNFWEDYKNKVSGSLERFGNSNTSAGIWDSSELGDLSLANRNLKIFVPTKYAELLLNNDRVTSRVITFKLK